MKNTTCQVGIGLRPSLASDLFYSEENFFSHLEICPENYMNAGGKRLRTLKTALERWPVLCHGLSGDFIGASAIDEQYVKAVKSILDLCGANFYSDHLCYTVLNGRVIHDLVPMPFNQQFLDRTVVRLKELSKRYERPLAIENVSAYMMMPGSTMSELAFTNKVLHEADCYLLLDVNNVYVNAKNFSFCPYEFIDGLDLGRVKQIHIAGHFKEKHDLLIDTHGAAIIKEVLMLFRYAFEKLTTKVPVIIERDHNIPHLTELVDESLSIKSMVK